jgi:hypothetical protein
MASASYDWNLAFIGSTKQTRE